MHTSLTDRRTFTDEITAYVMQQSQMLFVTFDADGRVTEANQQAEDIFPTPLVGKRLPDLFIDFHDKLSVETLTQSMNKPTLLSIHTRTHQPASYLFTFKKQTNGAILAFGELDYEQVYTSNEKLFESINEISNLTRQLQKTNAELKRLNDVKNQYLGIAAHDLRNPAGSIEGFSEFLIDELKESVSSDILEILELIYQESKCMFGIINSFLDYSAIESGKLIMDRQPTDIGTLLRECIQVNQAKADKQEIEIHYEKSPESIQLSVDPQKFRQVINNLLSNAIKYSHPQSRITVTLHDQEQQYAISVADQGQGIPKEEQEKLFKPFSPTSVKSTTGEKSTGLGLSIVKKIVEAHQGRITVESDVGKGTTFLICLPKNDNTNS